MKFLILFSLLLLPMLSLADDALKIAPFTTDGCSKFLDGIPNRNHNDEWSHCCLVHDLSYWMGGTKEERKEADSKLAACVNQSRSSEKKRKVALGRIIWLGTRLGGMPGPFSWSWGYGWESFRYRSLNKAEKIAVISELMLIEERLGKIQKQLFLSDEQMTFFTQAWEIKTQQLIDEVSQGLH